MNRRGDADILKALLQKMRDKVPGVVLRTTMIAGFPGETEEEFEELCEFIQEVKFERLGCFAYSREEDTPAGGDGGSDGPGGDAAPGGGADDRYSSPCRGRSTGPCVGKTFTVLVEDMDEESGLYYGRSYMDAPDIDTKVYFSSEQDLCPGDFVEVVIENVVEYDLVGHIKE